MKVTKDKIYLEDSTDTTTVYFIYDGSRTIEVLLYNGEHKQTVIDEKNSSSK